MELFLCIIYAVEKIQQKETSFSRVLGGEKMNDKINYFIYTYGDMRLGGIQRIIYENVKLYLSKGWQVIWIVPKKQFVEKGFRSVINSDTIQIMNNDEVRAFFEKKSNLCEINIYAISFDFGSFILNSNIGKKINNSKFSNVFIVPNVLGSGVKFNEEGNEAEYLFVQSVYKKMLDNGNILFCNQAQYTAFINYYNLNHNDASKLLIPINRKIDKFDIEMVNKRYLCNEIITVSRFDFPHKGYLIGLIDSFKKIKKKYPDLVLTIIGYGNDENKLREKISKLDSSVSKSITIEGAVSSDRLNTYFAKAKVFVGLAGAVSDAVSTGLPSIIVRQFTMNCEAYGFYQECPEKLVCEEPGKSIDDFLTYVFDLERKEYLAISKDGYEAYMRYVKSRGSNTFDNKVTPIKNNILNEKEIKICNSIFCRYISRRKRARNIMYLKNPLYHIKRLVKRYFNGNL